MSNERLNARNHDEGLFQFDWTYWTDASIDEGYGAFVAGSGDGIDVNEVMALLRSTIDFDAITIREARQMYGALNAQWGKLDPAAQELANRILDRLYQAYPGHFVPSDFIARGYPDPPPLIDQRDENYETTSDYVNELQGSDLAWFVALMDLSAHPATAADLRDAVTAARSTLRG